MKPKSDVRCSLGRETRRYFAPLGIVTSLLTPPEMEEGELLIEFRIWLIELCSKLHSKLS